MESKKSHIEVLELAISREIESISLYLAMAEHFSDQKISRAFIDVANEELQHKNDLELEVMKLGCPIHVEKDFADVSISDPEFFDRPMLPEMDYRGLLLFAIRKENESFRFYIDMLGSVIDRKSREILYALAEEEVRHKHRFQVEYDLLSAQET